MIARKIIGLRSLGSLTATAIIKGSILLAENVIGIMAPGSVTEDVAMRAHCSVEVIPHRTQSYRAKAS